MPLVDGSIYTFFFSPVILVFGKGLKREVKHNTDQKVLETDFFPPFLEGHIA